MLLHNAWSTYLASHLNEQLPEGYFAEPNVQFGIQIDVAAWEESEAVAIPFSSSWTAPPPTQTVPIVLITDLFEILVYSREGGPTLAAPSSSLGQRTRIAHRIPTHLSRNALPTYS